MRGIILPMTKTYELMVVAKPEFEGSDPKKAKDVVQKLIGSAVSTIKEVSFLGKKQLAYPIRKFTQAVYLLANIESPGLKVSDLEKQMKVEGGEVLRFLLTVKE